MGLAQELLQVAVHLATYEGVSPTQAALRRAISTAYYAVFHLLIEHAAQHWQGSPAAFTGLERSFQHGPMKNTSIQFRGAVWIDWYGDRQVVPSALRNAASVFVDLQEKRHTANYDNHKQWTVAEAQDVLKTAQSTFDGWLSVRANPMAGSYLLAMLLGKQRS